MAGFKVGDSVRLSGNGWDSYCTILFTGMTRKVLGMEEDGRGQISVSGNEDEYFVAWIHDDPTHELFAEVISPSFNGLNDGAFPLIV